MCCGSKAERGEITTTLLGAVTGLLPIRDSTCRPSQPSSSNQTSRFSALTWGDRRRTCADAGETRRVYFLFLSDLTQVICCVPMSTLRLWALRITWGYLVSAWVRLAEGAPNGINMNGNSTWEKFHVTFILGFGLFYISYYFHNQGSSETHCFGLASVSCLTKGTKDN